MMLGAPSPIDDGHDVSTFSCGQVSLDDWLKRRALANQKSGASRTFVSCVESRVVAYYALAAGAIDIKDRIEDLTAVGRRPAAFAGFGQASLQHGPLIVRDIAIIIRAHRCGSVFLDFRNQVDGVVTVFIVSRNLKTRS